MSYRAQSISMYRGDKAILSNVSIDVEPGRVTILIGPNGAGKSSLLSVMSGDESSEAGRVLLDDDDISNLTPAQLANRRAVMSQSASVVFDFSVEEILQMGWVQEQWGRHTMEQTVRELARQCGVSE